MLHKLSDYFASFSLRRKLIIIFMIFAILPSEIIYKRISDYYERDLIRDASKNIYEIVKTNNKVMYNVFVHIEDISKMILNNKTFYDIFMQDASTSSASKMNQSRAVSQELIRQFGTCKEVFECYIYMPCQIYGKSTWMNMEAENIESSGFYRIANKSNGTPIWMTGYNYGKVFDSAYFQNNKKYASQYPFTMIRKMRFYYSDNAGFYQMNRKDNSPVLFVHVLESTIRRLYKDSVGYDESLYVITNEEGTVISSDNSELHIGKKLPHIILKNVGDSGYKTIQWNDKEYLLSFDKMKKKNWTSISMVPLDALVAHTKQQMHNDQLSESLLLSVLAFLLSLIISATVNRPISALTKATKRVAKGDFSADTPVPKGKDLKLLTENFNYMEKEVSRLIEENYEIKLREKESQIQALSMQINPHFLYNTLNTINMLAIENNDFETSDLIVSLSRMMYITFSQKEEKILLSDETQWLKYYLEIMSSRFKGVFTSEISIPEELYQFKVPKLFLQPLVENAVIHAFAGRKKGGIIKIFAEKKGNDLQFLISDNGIGMSQEEINKAVFNNASSGGIGVTNVHKRMQLIYGENYRVQVCSKKQKGTIFKINIPMEI